MSRGRLEFWKYGQEPEPADVYLDVEEDPAPARPCPRCGRTVWDGDRTHCELCEDFKHDPPEGTLP